MKKTFKRAGIAVLSMSMLLSMGAMTAISSSAAGETITVVASTGFKASDTVSFYKVAEVDPSKGSWTWCNGLDDTIVGTTMNDVAAYDEAKNALLRMMKLQMLLNLKPLQVNLKDYRKMVLLQIPLLILLLLVVQLYQ